METFLAWYFLIGAFIVLPFTEVFRVYQIILVMTTWPLALLYSIAAHIKGD